MAMLKGAMAFCPGCKMEQKVPFNFCGAAVHTLGDGNYECHANTEVWRNVPEFQAKVIPDGCLPATLKTFERPHFLVEVVGPPSPAMRFMELEGEHVFAEDRQQFPIEGYVVPSTTNGRDWWTFFEHGWEHGELV